MLPGLDKVLRDAVAFYRGPDYSDLARAEHTDRAAANIVYAHAEVRGVGWPRVYV